MNPSGKIYLPFEDSGMIQFVSDHYGYIPNEESFNKKINISVDEIKKTLQMQKNFLYIGQRYPQWNIPSHLLQNDAVVKMKKNFNDSIITEHNTKIFEKFFNVEIKSVDYPIATDFYPSS